MSTNKMAPTLINPDPSNLEVARPSLNLEEAHPSLPVCAKPRVRDRIFQTACDLFYNHGIREVGVDAIDTAANTNKMSFYRSFASKDELVAEYLDKKSDEFWIWWDDIVSAHEGDARRQIEALFDAFVAKDRK